MRRIAIAIVSLAFVALLGSTNPATAATPVPPRHYAQEIYLDLNSSANSTCTNSAGSRCSYPLAHLHYAGATDRIWLRMAKSAKFLVAYVTYSNGSAWKTATWRVVKGHPVASIKAARKFEDYSSTFFVWTVDLYVRRR